MESCVTLVLNIVLERVGLCRPTVCYRTNNRTTKGGGLTGIVIPQATLLAWLKTYNINTLILYRTVAVQSVINECSRKYRLSPFTRPFSLSQSFYVCVSFSDWCPPSMPSWQPQLESSLCRRAGATSLMTGKTACHQSPFVKLWSVVVTDIPLNHLTLLASSVPRRAMIKICQVYGGMHKIDQRLAPHFDKWIQTLEPWQDVIRCHGEVEKGWT